MRHELALGADRRACTSKSSRAFAARSEYASEFRYRNPIVTDKTLCIVISQSGETADTLAAMREAKRRGAKTLGLVNVVGSTIAREDDGGIYLHAGPEIGVASTKAFTSQVIALALLTLKLARLRNMSVVKGREVAEAMLALPAADSSDSRPRAGDRGDRRAFKDATNFLYLGRGYNFPVALEGALKLKEISYIHAEGYPAAEMKHGPIALIDEEMPVVFVAPHDAVFDKVVSNVQEVKARGGRGHLHHEPARAGARGADRLRDPRPADDRHAVPDAHGDSAAAAGVLHRREARAERGSAAEPGEVGDGRVGAVELGSQLDVADVRPS